jgi:hypothetical protein
MAGVSTAEKVYVVGSIDQLANWSPIDAIALSATNYPTWSGESLADVSDALLINDDGSYGITPGEHDVRIYIHPRI